MSGSVNRVILIGNLCADPEIRRTQDGKPIVNMRLATNESWLDKRSGERKEKSEFHTVVIFNEGLAGVAEKYLKKGAKLYVSGQLQTRKWQDRDGNDRYSTEVALQGFNSELVMLDGAPGGGRDVRDVSNDKAQDRPFAGAYNRGRDDVYLVSQGARVPAKASADLDDNEIPF